MIAKFRLIFKKKIKTLDKKHIVIFSSVYLDRHSVNFKISKIDSAYTDLSQMSLQNMGNHDSPHLPVFCYFHQ